MLNDNRNQITIELVYPNITDPLDKTTNNIIDNADSSNQNIRTLNEKNYFIDHNHLKGHARNPSLNAIAEVKRGIEVYGFGKKKFKRCKSCIW